MPTYTFTEDEARAAHEEWGCNCGPAALAFAMQAKLDVVRPAIPHFAERRYTSPTMMREALTNLGRSFVALPAGPSRDIKAAFSGAMTLVRIQWTGPWIVDGKPAKWAARQTHWIACYVDDKHNADLVFDVNGGVRSYREWTQDIVPADGTRPTFGGCNPRPA